MKKFTSLFAALFCAALFVNATTISFGSDDLSIDAMTKSGVTVTPAKTDAGATAPAINTYEGVNTLRVYADNTLTFNAGSDNIVSITLKLNGSTNAKRLTTMTATTGEVAVVGDPDWIATWTNAGANTVTFTVGHDATLGTDGASKRGQIHIMEIIVETTGEGGGNEGGDEGDYTYEFEPMEVTTITDTYDYAEYMVDEEYGLIDVYMVGEISVAELLFFASDVTNGLPAGTYTISESQEDGTVMASPGGDDDYDYPSYLATDFNSEGYYTSAYYMMSGTVTVSVDGQTTKIVVNADSYYGSTLNLTYEGEMEEYIEDAVENVTADALNIRIDNGNMIVPAQAGERVSVYNVAGQMLYSTVAAGETTVRGLQAGQILIVRVADQAAKVVF